MSNTTPNPDALRSVLPYIDSWLEYRAFKLRVPGVQVAVYFDGELQFSRAYGVSNLETNEPLRTDHLFRIASHSKTFTATAILQLFESGRLRLDDTAGVFVPELLGSPVADVTVRELLEHGGGILRDGLDGDYWQLARPFPDEAELLGMLQDGADKQGPNEGFNYTNLGYSLLGLIIAAASGRPYNDYVQAEIVERLGLANTGPEWDPARADQFAAGHSGFHTSQTRHRIDHVDTRAMAAATGFYGTAEDLVHYASAHFFGDERLLTDSSKRLQQRELWKSDAAQAGSAHYGLGMVIDKIGEHRVVGHSGGYPGHITRTLFDPELGLAISVLTNAIDGPASELSDGILRLLDAAGAAPGSAADAPVPSVEANAAEGSSALPDAGRFTGRFANVWGVMDVVRLGGRLVALSPGGANPLGDIDELEVTGENTVKIVKGNGFGSIGETMVFDIDENRAITRVRGGGGMSMWPLNLVGGMVTSPVAG